MRFTNNYRKCPVCHGLRVIINKINPNSTIECYFCDGKGALDTNEIRKKKVDYMSREEKSEYIDIEL